MIKNMLLVCTSVIVSIFFVELYFVLFVAQSDGFGMTISSEKWFEKHWKPINLLGYRDDELDFESDEQYRIAVVGDSFVAGYGINDYTNRFPNKLQEILGKPWTVNIIADNGWGTLEELEAVKKYPLKPKTIVLSYFINDIVSTASLMNVPMNLKKFLIVDSMLLKIIVNHSEAANFIYWRWFRNVGNSMNKYMTTARELYDNQEVLSKHKEELQSFVDFCNLNDIRLIVVAFPSLTDVNGTSSITSSICKFFEGKGVETIDLAEHFASNKVEDLVVNPYDAHPNEKSSLTVARLIAERII